MKSLITQLIALVQLYSVQVLAVLATINTFIASRDDIPWWFVLGINVVGVVVGIIVRQVPQPKVAAKLKAAKAT